ncbi:MAG: PfkB family carbohydrate kinase, partial [Anaerolineae bacterium]
GAARLWDDRWRLLVVTAGAAGCAYFTANTHGYVPGFAVEAVDTTGAGDGFVAGLLAGLLDHGLRWDDATIEAALRLGNAVGALTTTRRGAIPALPTRAAVEQFMAARGSSRP